MDMPEDNVRIMWEANWVPARQVMRIVMRARLTQGALDQFVEDDGAGGHLLIVGSDVELEDAREFAEGILADLPPPSRTP